MPGPELLLAFLGSRFIADLLYDVSPRDPLVFLSVAGSVLVIAVAAALAPACRAGRIDPARSPRGLMFRRGMSGSTTT